MEIVDSKKNPIFEEEIITYQELKDGKTIEGDYYGLVKKSLCPQRKKTFLSNPFLVDWDACVLHIQRADGIVVGNNTLIPTIFKAGDEIIDCCGGSNLIVVDEFQKYGLGAYHIMYPIKNSRKDVIIYASLSLSALKAYKAVKFNDFCLNKYWQIRRSEFIIDKIGIKGFVNKCITGVIDKFLLTVRYILDMCKSPHNYHVEREDIVPLWVDDIVLHDGHKYMELHNHNWMQWNLDNMFYDIEGNKNCFYTIKRDGLPWGFFFIKYRMKEFASYTKPKYICSIMEWGSIDESILNESDIYDLALETINEKVDIVEFASNNVTTQKHMKKRMFFHHGEHHIVFKDIKKKYNDAGDPSFWRLRYGYSDSIFNQ